MNAQVRIGIFGGSFNPIHCGHEAIARQAMCDWQLTKLYVIPACVSPFKTNAQPDLIAGGFTHEARLEFAQAAFRNDPNVCVWDIEIARGGVSYAIDTVRSVRARHEGAEIFFILGEDSVKDLSKWHDWLTLRTLCRFVYYPRTKESSTEIRRRIVQHEAFDTLVSKNVHTRIMQYLKGNV